MHLNMYFKNHSHPSNNTKCISNRVDQNSSLSAMTQNAITCVDQTPPMPARSENMEKLNPSHASNDTKCISTCVDKTHTMPTSTQNVSQNELTNLNPTQRGHKIHLNLCCPNPSHDTKNTKRILTCVIFISSSVDQTPPMPAMTQNVSQLVLTKPIPCNREHKMYLNLDCLNSAHEIEEKISSLQVLTKPLLCQRGHKI